MLFLPSRVHNWHDLNISIFDDGFGQIFTALNCVFRCAIFGDLQTALEDYHSFFRAWTFSKSAQVVTANQTNPLWAKLFAFSIPLLHQSRPCKWYFLWQLSYLCLVGLAKRQRRTFRFSSLGTFLLRKRVPCCLIAAKLRYSANANFRYLKIERRSSVSVAGELANDRLKWSISIQIA